MGGYVNGGICSECGGDATATGDWRHGETVETVECHNFDCGYVLRKENGNETGDYATQEEIQELRDWNGGYEVEEKKLNLFERTALYCSQIIGHTFR